MSWLIQCHYGNESSGEGSSASYRLEVLARRARRLHEVVERLARRRAVQRLDADVVVRLLAHEEPPAAARRRDLRRHVPRDKHLERGRERDRRAAVRELRGAAQEDDGLVPFQRRGRDLRELARL